MQDGRWNYTWDAENRLKRIESAAISIASEAPRLRIDFAYDWQGRRISKNVYAWDTHTSSFILHTSSIYLYDGWNMIAEYRQDLQTSLFTLHASFVWGLDVSGTLQGAGGVGGLLFAKVGSETYTPFYDGNGNVTGQVALTDGSLAASYEYGPFGELLRSSGAAAEAIPYRFSTKYEDAETGLSYYGYRYYDSANGRWLNRDPIGEQGGLNLYGMVENDPVNRIDFLGLSPCCTDGSSLNCSELKLRIERMRQTIKIAIDDFSGYNSFFEGARSNARLSLLQSGIFAVYGISGAVKGLTANAVKAAPILLGGGGGYLPIAVSTGSGTLARQGTKAFSQSLRLAESARNSGAVLVGVQNVAPDLAQEVSTGLSTTADRIFDPAGNLARVQIATGNELSRQLADTIKSMQSVYRELLERYARCCN